MINKQSIWFLTLFSLILVLSVYYITMPNELLLTSKTNGTVDKDTNVVIKESELLASLRLESDEQVNKELDILKGILTNSESSTDDKNNAFDKIKEINELKAKEQNLEKLIEAEFKLKSFIKIDNDQIRVIVESETHDTTLANNIMRKIQENFENKMYITVKFQK